MRSARQVLTLVHRWTGIALAAFLVVIAGTGALLPFQTDLQRLIAPERFVVPPTPGARSLDWLTLHEIAERRSGGVASTLILHQDGGAAPAYGVAPRPGRPPLGFDEIVLDPYTGREIARDTGGSLADGKAQLLPFLYLVHQNLALGDWGTLLFGVAALAWTIDCFVGFYLTLPVARRGWWRHWGRSWRMRLPLRRGFRLTMDLHRAPGLWLWPMLFVFAWSGVAFNLPQVYMPVMRTLAGFEYPSATPPARAAHAPRIGWPEALRVARSLAAGMAAKRGISIGRERELRYVAADNGYAFAIRTSLDESDDGANTWLDFDADTGRLTGTEFPTGGARGNTIDYWLGLLHEASVFGLPFRVFVSATAIAIVVVTVTGVLIWLRKRSSRRWRTRRADLEASDSSSRGPAGSSVPTRSLLGSRASAARR